MKVQVCRNRIGKYLCGGSPAPPDYMIFSKDMKPELKRNQDLWCLMGHDPRELELLGVSYIDQEHWAGDVLAPGAGPVTMELSARRVTQDIGERMDDDG